MKGLMIEGFDSRGSHWGVGEVDIVELGSWGAGKGRGLVTVPDSATH